MSSTLCLHSGGALATRDEVANIPTPDRTRTWTPIAHERLIEDTLTSLAGVNLQITGEEHALARDGARYFGVFNLAPRPGADYTLAVGLRNSHDRSCVAEMALGTRVFVCDNLAFSGEVHIKRRHTGGILDDLRPMIADAVDRIMPEGERLRLRVDRYKAKRLHDVKANDLVIGAVDRHIIANRRITQVLQEWREPRHDEFAPRTAWSLFNAFTEILKSSSRLSLQRRTARLHRLFDSYAGISA